MASLRPLPLPRLVVGNDDDDDGGGGANDANDADTSVPGGWDHSILVDDGASDDRDDRDGNGGGNDEGDNGAIADATAGHSSGDDAKISAGPPRGTHRAVAHGRTVVGHTRCSTAATATTTETDDGGGGDDDGGVFPRGSSSSRVRF